MNFFRPYRTAKIMPKKTKVETLYKQYEMLLNFMPTQSCLGRPIELYLIDILNAILYTVRSGCTWRMMPADFPPWQTVCYHFNN